MIIKRWKLNYKFWLEKTCYSGLL